MSDAAHCLSVEGLSFAYGDGKRVLDGIALTARTGQLVCLLGPNGSGKTTALRCMLGLLKPGGGKVQLDGRAVADYTRRQLARVMAYVPQFPTSAFAFDCRQIVMMGRFARMGSLGLSGEADRQVVRQAMVMTETTGFAERTLEELSGGEAQRVMIARALAQQPEVLLLDEPTSHLDVRHQMGIYRMMVRLAHDWPMAVVCVSHDVNMAARFADRLVLLRDGRVVAAGTPAEVIRADVLRETYSIEVTLIQTGAGVPLVVPR
ncbi:MAG TPA: ABC transporter ATP-binding protein [Phycisphaerae bacterium]|nr:ABC transporter ATP-binding protein [Phycisphaerae bacterium]